MEEELDCSNIRMTNTELTLSAIIKCFSLKASTLKKLIEEKEKRKNDG